MKEVFGVICTIIVVIILAVLASRLVNSHGLDSFLKKIDLTHLPEKTRPEAPALSDHEWVPYAGNNPSYTAKQQLVAYDANNPSTQIGSFKPGTKLEILRFKRDQGLVLVRYAQEGGRSIDAICMASQMDVAFWKISELPLSESDIKKMANLYGTYLGIEYVLDWIDPRYPVVVPETQRLRDKLNSRCKPIVQTIEKLINLQSPAMIQEFQRTKDKAYLDIRELLSKRGPPARQAIQSTLIPAFDKEIDRIAQEGEEMIKRAKK